MVLKPATTQRTSPAEGLLQLADFPAAEAAPPVEKNVPDAGAKSVGLYIRSNWTAAGWLPFVVRLTVTLTLDPGAPDPPDNVSTGFAAAATPRVAAIRPRNVTILRDRPHETSVLVVMYPPIQFGFTVSFLKT